MFPSFSDIREYYLPVRPYRKNLAVHLVFRFSILALAVFIANQTGAIVTLLSAGAEFSEIFAVAERVFAAICLSIVLLFVTIWQKASWSHVESRMLRETRRRVFSEYLGKEVSVAEATGKTIGLFETGILSWVRISSLFAIEFPLDITAFAVVFCYLALTEIWLLPIVAVYVIGTTWLMFGFQKKIEPLRKRRTVLFEGRSRSFVRAIMERRTVFMYDAVDDELESLNRWEGDIQKNVDALAAIRVPLYRFPQFFLDVIKMSVVLTLAYFVSVGQATMGDLVSSSIAFGILDKYFQGLVDSFQSYADEQTNYRRLREYLGTMDDFRRYREGSEFVPKKGELVFRGVTFSYSEGKESVIRNLSLVFEGGKKTAIVGRSGAGKSTVVKLLLGLSRPDSGAVLADGQDVSSLRLDSYFSHIGYLPQEPSVFDGTVRENLRYGLAGEVEDAELEKALSHARCDFVSALPNGLETEIGERGIRLSGGERQRLAIARIFLRNPEILVLDEPTSALDSFSEAAVTEALHELFSGKTVIVVAHRLQTVKEADNIVVMADGGILESGTHEELLAIGGEYSRMVDLQDGNLREEGAGG